MKITVALLRDLEKQVAAGDISYSRMVEILNEKVDESKPVVDTQELIEEKRIFGKDIRTLIESQLNIGDEMRYGNWNKAGLIFAELDLKYDFLNKLFLPLIKEKEESDNSQAIELLKKANVLFYPVMDSVNEQEQENLLCMIEEFLDSQLPINK